MRGRRRAEPALDAETTHRQKRAVAAAVAGMILVLFGLAGADFMVVRALDDLGAPGEPLTIRVRGHQWWWELTYEDTVPVRTLTTANEIHIPAGRPVLLKLESADVIHSFWVPELNGKQDLVPGHQTSFWIEAAEPGVYEGACAEFCGLQHARMRIVVIAEPPAAFSMWYENQLRASVPPSDPLAMRGRDVFLTGPCVMCHTIRGTPAGSRVGPDLTHVASRRTLAAGTIPNVRGHLAGWISNAQAIKPGNRMPPNTLASSDLQALLAYLESLR